MNTRGPKKPLNVRHCMQINNRLFQDHRFLKYCYLKYSSFFRLHKILTQKADVSSFMQVRTHSKMTKVELNYVLTRFILAAPDFWSTLKKTFAVSGLLVLKF